MITIIFEYQNDNEPAALDEMKLRIEEFSNINALDLTISDLKVTESKKCNDTPNDWFDDYKFTIKAKITSETTYDGDVMDLIIEKEMDNKGIPDMIDAHMEIYKVCQEKRDDDNNVIDSEVIFISDTRERALEEARKYREENNYYKITIETWEKTLDDERLIETTLENQY